MIDEVLYCVVMTDRSESRGAGAEILAAQEYQISSWKDEESGEVKHTLYFQKEEDAKAALEFLRSQVTAWREFGIDLSEPESAVIRKEDWAESWKIHFKTSHISERLVVRPSWEKYSPKGEEQVIVLDPGMSFGTGQHATTKSCMAAIDKFTKEAAGKTLSLLDAGSGSGILSIAACKLGCAPVHAFDIDPDTVPIAHENARMNGIPDEQLPIDCCSLLDFKTDVTYDIVAANILSSALIAGSEKLLSLVKPGGKLILAGILDKEYESVREHFEKMGCKQLFSVQEKEWRGGAFSVPENK